MSNQLGKPEHVRRHETVAANAQRAKVAPADVVTTLALMGETVGDLQARLPIMRDLHDWLARIEGKLDAVIASRDYWYEHCQKKQAALEAHERLAGK